MGTQQVSGKTFADLITLARIRLNDNEGNYFAGQPEMVGWINDARMKAALDSGCFQDTESIDLVAGQLEYPVVSPYARLHAVQYVNADGVRKGLTKGSPAGVGQISDVGEPVSYYEFNGKIGIYPTLSSKTTETVSLYISEIVYDTKTDADAVDTPAILDEALVWYVIAQHHWKDEKFSAHAQAMAKFDAEVYKVRVELYPGFNE